MVKHLVNTKGMSLLQVTMAMGLMSLMAYGTMSMFENGRKNEANLRHLFEARELYGELGDVVKSPNCGLPDLAVPIAISSTTWTTLATVNLPSGIFGRTVQLKQGDKYGAFTVGQVAFAPILDLKDNTLKYLSLDGANASDFAAATMIRGALLLQLNSPETPKAPLRLPVNLTLSADKSSIVSCKTAADNDTLQLACSSFGGDWIEADSRCQLPCPPGLEKKDDICIVKDADDAKSETYCNANEQCNVNSKFIL